jgi:hypothetical protein
MKKAILGLALVGLAFGCKTDKQAAISDASSATPAATSCCKDKADCSAEAKAHCSEMNKECSKTCPVTGKSIE